jgi:MFS family permease
MRRQIFNLAAAVSLVLSVAAAILWCCDVGYYLLLFRGTGWTVGRFYGPTVGLEFSIETVGPTYEWRLPYWKAVLIGLVLPVLWMLIHFRVRRLMHTCRQCGYDLRATPDRCPECGTVPAKPPHNPPMQRTATASSGAVE